MTFRKIFKICAFCVVTFICVSVYSQQVKTQAKKSANKSDIAKSSDESKSQKTDLVKVKFSPKKDKEERNPFLSLADIAKTKAEEERLRRLRAKAQAKKRPKKKLTPLQKAKRYIQLQGIINNQAIINGEPRRVGNVVLGAKIVSIKTSSVTFKVGKQYFTKSIR